MGRFVKHYNAGNYEAVFLMFADDMKEVLPMESTHAFLNGLNSGAGKITDYAFIAKNNTLAVYKTIFERGTFTINMSVSKKGLIEGLLVQPYVGEVLEAVDYIGEVDGLNRDLVLRVYNAAKGFPNGTQLSLSIVENNVPKYFGLIRENDTIKFMDNKSCIFEIGSITKVFTATLLAAMVNEGSISIDDNISRFFDFPFNDIRTITFESLANHTSGLPRLPSNFDGPEMDHNNPYRHYNEASLYSYLKESLSLISVPGQKSEYSNLGSGLLAYTLGRVGDDAFGLLLHEKVFSKYAMSATYTSWQNVEGSVVGGLDYNGNEVSRWDFDVLAGAGAMLSNVEDLTRFVQAHFDTSNLELMLTRQPTFVVNDNMQMGLGWHILTGNDGKAFYWHNGGTGGYTSSLAIDMSNNNAIVILSNVSAFNPNMGKIDRLCFELIRNL